ncbi:MAG TPA: aminoglycoside phosphotransferase family protein [Dermatophilaceae bacterium]|nr:aminoglycoside phosphotransferase family protein [Dermatophilaceae bacterium]
MTLRLPPAFVAALRGRPADGFDDGDGWLSRLPRLVDDRLGAWQLAVDDAPVRAGACALVVPVVRDGQRLVLKLTWPHPEARHEHLALRAWGGRGAARLVAADPARWALLLERLDADRDLQDEPLDAACERLGALLEQLARPALPQLRRLSDIASATEVAFAAAPPQLPRRFADQARSLVRDLTRHQGGHPDVDGTLLHTDLHFANVLAGTRQPWLAIDPKPVAGEAAYEVAPALWNRWGEALASRDVRRHLRRRLGLICERAGIDQDRARAWTLVRAVANGIGAVREDDRDALTVAITVAKAMSG